MTDSTKTQANSTKRVPVIKATVLRADMNGNPADTGFAAGLKLECTALRQAVHIYRDQLSAEIIHEATIHGLKQKLVDAAAISRDPETGRSATERDKWTAVMAVYQRLRDGEWNLPREGGGSGSYLLRALCRVYPNKTPEQLREWLDGKTDAEKKALELNAKIAEAILAIKAEKLGADEIDTDSLMADLDD